MLDDEFNRQRANLVRDLATRADPFTRRRLLELALRYEKGSAKTSPPRVTITGQNHKEQSSGGNSSQQS